MSTKREIRLSLLSPSGVPFTDKGPQGYPEAYNADASAPLMIKVEITCDMGWHTLQTIPLKNFG